MPAFTDVQFRKKFRVCQNAFYGICQLLRLAFSAYCSEEKIVRIPNLPIELIFASGLAFGFPRLAKDGVVVDVATAAQAYPIENYSN